MSRTDKDRPYWVKVQDEGVIEHCHHSGRYDRRQHRIVKRVYDDEGNPVMEDREVKLTAKRVIETQPRIKYATYTAQYSHPVRNLQGAYVTEYQATSAKRANPTYSEAEHLIAMGLPDAMVTIRVDRVQKTEEYWENDSFECDLDEENDKHHPWRNNCGKELPDWKVNRYYCRCSRCRPGDEPRQRTRQRNMLHNMRKAANSGEEDWEDSFDEVSLSKPDMHHRGWC